MPLEMPLPPFPSLHHTIMFILDLLYWSTCAYFGSVATIGLYHSPRLNWHMQRFSANVKSRLTLPPLPFHISTLSTLDAPPANFNSSHSSVPTFGYSVSIIARFGSVSISFAIQPPTNGSSSLVELDATQPLDTVLVGDATPYTRSCSVVDVHSDVVFWSLAQDRSTEDICIYDPSANLAASFEDVVLHDGYTGAKNSVTDTRVEYAVSSLDRTRSRIMISN